MNIFSKNKLYFLGICGTGMGNAAIFYKQKGYDVLGSDNAVYPPMSDLLHSEDIKVYMPYSISNLKDHRDALFVIGNAISRGNPELEFILSNRLPYTSFPELLRTTHLFSKKSIVIAGTHGKTTLSSLVSFILHYANLDPDFIIGGIPYDFNSGAHLGSGKYTVIEGDEYDTSFFDKRPKFVHYVPNILVLTSIELDHTDIYPNISRMEYAYHQMVRTMPGGSHVIACGDYPSVLNILKSYPSLDIVTYGVKPENKYVVELNDDVVINRQVSIRSCLRGIHNALNITAAYLLSAYMGIYSSLSIKAIGQFRGVKRRLELFHTAKDRFFYDDFGHHPTAVKKTIEGLKLLHPGRNICAVFEPRTNTTRTNVFLGKYKEAFMILDGLVIFNNKNLKQVEDPLDISQIRSFLMSRGIFCRIEDDPGAIFNHIKGFDIIILFSSASMDNLKNQIKENAL